MKKITLGILVTLAALLSSFALDSEPAKGKITVTLGIPTTGDKLTFRFHVRNDGDKAIHVFGPFYNETRLIVIYPDGKKDELCTWKSMSDAPAPNLQPGKTIQSDVDITKWLTMKDTGSYKVSFTVNGTQSNQIVIMKD